MAHVTSVTFRNKKQAGERLAVLTAYDYPTARLLDECGIDAILVGDSCGMAVMGRPNTLSVTMDEMVHHTRMVSAAADRALVIADMPFLSYQTSPARAVENAGRLVAEGGAQAVKLEGPAQSWGPAIEAILAAGIPVMGHLGLTPQSIHRLGGYKVQGRDDADRAFMEREARALEAAGVFSIVLEVVPDSLAAAITEALSVPTIGIGAGPHCDGQVLVLHDMLGFGIATKHAKVYTDLRAQMSEAVTGYIGEVRSGAFPAQEHTFT